MLKTPLGVFFNINMKKIKSKNARKIGLIYAVSMLVGTVIGIGIFLKNDTVFRMNNNSYVSILVAWVLASIISLAAAWSLAEVGSSSANDASGVSSWIKKMLHPKLGYYVSFIQPFFYYSIISFAISIYAGETLFKIFDINGKIHIAAIIVTGITLFLIFVVLNFISINVSKKIQLSLSSLKIIPILLVIIIGFIFLYKQPNSSLFNSNNELSNSTFSFSSIIICLPAILFSFDSFTGVGNLSLDIKKPEKNVPLSIVIGMGLVVVVYLLITISLILIGQGSALNIFKNASFLNEHGKNVLLKIFLFFIFISMIGVINGFSAYIIRSWDSLVENNIIYRSDDLTIFANKMIRRPYDYKVGFILTIVSILFIFILVGIPSMVKNTDAYIDGLSNFPTTLFFGFYGLAILGGLINRKTKKVHVYKIFGFYFTAPIAIIGCLFVLGFQIFYTFSFRNINEANFDSQWGLFYNNGVIIKVWESSVFFAIYMLLSPILFFINEWLKRKKNSDIVIKCNRKENDQIIWNAIDNNFLQNNGVKNE